MNNSEVIATQLSATSRALYLNVFWKNTERGFGRFASYLLCPLNELYLILIRSYAWEEACFKAINVKMH